MAAGIFVLVAGVSVSNALVWVALLVHPLMMVGMTYMMNGKHGSEVSNNDDPHGPDVDPRSKTPVNECLVPGSMEALN